MEKDQYFHADFRMCGQLFFQNSLTANKTFWLSHYLKLRLFYQSCCLLGFNY